MIYRTLGQSGLKVSALTLGTMMFGEQTNTEDSLRIIDKAWDQGINFIDTADVYTAGRSEELVGEAIAHHRQDWVVASKVGFGPADGLPNRSGLSRKRIFNALEASLTRLGHANHFGDAPTPVVGQPPVADLALADQVANRRHRDLQRGVVVFAVQVVDVQVVVERPGDDHIKVTVGQANAIAAGEHQAQGQYYH